MGFIWKTQKIIVNLLTSVSAAYNLVESKNVKFH